VDLLVINGFDNIFVMKRVFYAIAFSIFSVTVVYGATANISNLVFINDSLSVNPNELSGAIKVETQNSLGAAEKVDETNDVTFKSSSATGQFLNDKGGPVSATMSKNTSSRTFYYKDSAEGEHKITVRITGRESGETFEAETMIDVGDGNGQNSQPSRSNSTRSSNSSSSISSHSGQTAISELKSKTGFKVDAGRERLTTAYTPIEFVAEASEEKIRGSQLDFYWSFGDGTSGRGSKITHAYQFPGDYTVILNAAFSKMNNEQRAVARTEVKVVDPEISIESFKSGNGGYIELENGSDFEINLGGWIFDAGQSKFAIAPDTLIKPHSSLKIPASWLIETESLSLLYPQNITAATYKKDKSKLVYTADLARQRSMILEQIVALKKELLEQNEYTSQAIVSEPQSVVGEQEQNDDQSAALIKAFEESENMDSSIQTVKDRVVDFFRGLFGR
jgi:hypothetical protein